MVTITLCRCCRKAIAAGEAWVGWWHFIGPADGHDAVPVEWFLWES